MKANISEIDFEKIVKDIKNFSIIKGKKTKDNDKMYFIFNSSNVRVQIIRVYNAGYSDNVYQSWQVGYLFPKPEDTNNCICFNTCEIINFLKAHSGDDCDNLLNVISDHNKITIARNNIENSIEGFISDMPEIPSEKVKTSFVIDTDMLEAVIDTVSVNESYRYFLRGVHIITKDDKFICESSDAHRASIKETELEKIEISGDRNINVIIPGIVIQAILATSRHNCKIEITKNHAICNGIVMPLIIADYPNLQMIVPNHTEEKLEIQLSELEKALKALKGKTNNLSDCIEVTDSVFNAKYTSLPVRAEGFNWSPVHLRRGFLADIVKYLKKADRYCSVIFDKNSGRGNCIKVTAKGNKNYTGVVCRIVV